MCVNENLYFALGLEGNEGLEGRKRGVEDMKAEKRGKEVTVSAVRSNLTT